MTGLLLVPLVVFTAFGVDLGAWYAQSAKQQRAVDAASLAGVVQLPTRRRPRTAARASLIANGFICCNPQCSVQPDGTSPTSANPCVFTFPSAAGQEMGVSLYQTGHAVLLRHRAQGRVADSLGDRRLQPPHPAGQPEQHASATTRPGRGPSRTCGRPSTGPTRTMPGRRPVRDACALADATASDLRTTDCLGWPRRPTANTATTRTATLGRRRPSRATWARRSPCRSTTPPLEAGNTSAALREHSVATAASPPPMSSSTPPGRLPPPTSDSRGRTGRWHASGACTAGPGYKVFGPGNRPARARSLVHPLHLHPDPGRDLPAPGQDERHPERARHRHGLERLLGEGHRQRGTPSPRSTRSTTCRSGRRRPGSTATFYLANIGPSTPGHTLVVDLYDPGRLATRVTTSCSSCPPRPASPPYVPTPGRRTIACNYNSTPRPTIGGSDTDTARELHDPDANAECRQRHLQRRLAAGADHHPAGDSTPARTDCWWTIKYNFGAGSRRPTAPSGWSTCSAIPSTSSTDVARSRSITRSPDWGGLRAALVFAPCPDSSTSASSTSAAATAAPAACRPAARRTCPRAGPTAATAATAATSGWWPTATWPRCWPSATTRTAGPAAARTARARSATAPGAPTSLVRGARGHRGPRRRRRAAGRPGRTPATAGWPRPAARAAGATPASCPTAAGPPRSPSRASRARSAGCASSSSSWPTWRWSASPTWARAR